MLRYFLHFGDMFRLLRDILVPFSRLAVYLSKKYNYTIKAENVKKITLGKFVEAKKEDRHLSHLYKEVCEKALN